MGIKASSKLQVQVFATDTHGRTRTGYFYKNNEWILIKFLLDRIYRIIRIFFCLLSFEMKLSKSIRFAETIMLVKVRNDHY